MTAANAMEGLLVLLGEDDPDSAFLAHTILRKAGATIELAEDGEAVLTKAQEKTFDLIVLDMELPKLNGCGTAKLLRERGYSGPIIAHSAHAFETHRKLAIEAGCSGYITKPVHVADFVSRVLAIRHEVR